MRHPRKILTRAVPVIGLSGALLAGLLSPSGASSHREAPAITEDPVADNTDVYAFVAPDSPDKLTVVANVNPFEEPAGGPNFHRFGDDVLYQILVDSDGDAVSDTRYQFRFKTQIMNPKTFLYNTGPITSLDDPDWNMRQTYSVEEIRDGRRMWVADNLVVPPANIGPRSTPDYPALASAAVANVGDTGIRVFAGPRDDPFFVDLGSIFDLGGLRPLNDAHLIPLPVEEGEDYVAGYNVHSLVIQVPLSRLIENGDPVLGVWATTARHQFRVLADNRSGQQTMRGPFVQVSRLGNPLINEVVIPLGLKDRWNASYPRDDVANFAGPVLNSELAGLIQVLYPGVDTPEAVDLGLGLGGREDLATVFLTGIPGVNQPANLTVPAEMIRINTSIPTGFPNGRLLTDDVVDTELRVVAGATDFSPEFNVFPNNALTDGVGGNDVSFLDSFPYVGLPHQGY